ncbi:tRNA (adenosine(37)-N6)-threonylcarbamoyltransferase complex ATPase subunit type 1 TsaE [Candidatus Pacebacteria bacterium]|nr:tRNA (adenosine(37)-N6)-threonylcarbamoyltransferase complex ATPase subunit type 1 TsaE [Candidatus Paceibacterota bacterium]
MKVKLEKMEEFAEGFLSEIRQGDLRQSLPTGQAGGDDGAVVVGLSGNLGAGKTTFTQQVAKKLGVKDAITSPTFVIMKRYELPKDSETPGQARGVGVDLGFENLIHIDAYRLESGKELEVLDFKEMLNNPSNLIFIEWPEKVSEILPSDMMTIKFEVVDEETREIKLVSSY